MHHPPSTAEVLDRILNPLAECLTPAAARALVKFRADPSTQAHIAALAEKCNDGRLSPKERAEYESYVHAIDLIAVLQSKARRVLKSRKRS